MKKIVTGLLMGAQAAQYANLKDCQAAAKRKVDERISQGDINVPNYTCKRGGNGWRVAVG